MQINRLVSILSESWRIESEAIEKSKHLTQCTDVCREKAISNFGQWSLWTPQMLTVSKHLYILKSCPASVSHFLLPTFSTQIGKLATCQQTQWHDGREVLPHSQSKITVTDSLNSLSQRKPRKILWRHDNITDWHNKQDSCCGLASCTTSQDHGINLVYINILAVGRKKKYIVTA